MQLKTGTITREYSHYANVWKNEEIIMLLGLKVKHIKQQQQQSNTKDIQIIKDIKVLKGLIISINETDVARIQEICLNNEVTIVSDGSQKTITGIWNNSGM